MWLWLADKQYSSAIFLLLQEYMVKLNVNFVNVFFGLPVYNFTINNNSIQILYNIF